MPSCSPLIICSGDAACWSVCPQTPIYRRNGECQGCSRSIDLGEKDQDLLVELDLLGDLDHHQ